MKVCIEIKRRIDEADQPNQPGLEISRHTAHCADCRAFADERTALRSMLGAGARVSAPANFDALLNARLAEIREPKSFSWFSPAGYLRLGAATAALAVMFFASQSSALFTSSNQALSAANVSGALPKSSIDHWVAEFEARASQPPAINYYQSPAVSIVRYDSAQRSGNAQSVRVSRAPRAADGYVSLDGGGVILVREQNGEREVTVPTVSVGAQPLLYTNRPSQPVRSVAVSF